MRDFIAMFRVTGGFRRFIILLLLRCPFEALRTCVIAAFLRFAFRSVTGENVNELYMTCAIFALGCMFLFLYNGTVWRAYSTFATKWAGRLRRILFRHISGLSLQQIEAKSSGEWITRLNSDAQAATAIQNQSLHLPHAAVSVINTCLSSILLIMVNPSFFGVTVLFVVPNMLISQFIIARPMTSLALDVQEATAENTTDLNTIVTCADTAAIYDAQVFLLKRFEESSLKLRKASMKMRRQAALGSGMLPLVGMGGYLVMLLIGGKMIAAGKIDFGTLTAAFQYRGGILVGSMMFVNSLINIKATMAGVKRINDTMNITPEVLNG
jgi:ABC-type bacteriocin/lantibiotic exporter with double-glycine peptidase domain